MTRQLKAQEEPVPIRSSNKAKMRVILLVVSIAAVLIFLGIFQKHSSNLLTHVQDRPKVVAEIVKSCSAEAHAKGLTNADAMKYSDECFKNKIAEFDSKKK
jgi:hypothetical protein